VTSPRTEWIDSALMATAIALVVLLPVELVSWLIVSDPATHNAAWVADRWGSSLWRAVDWVFLVVALVHGGISTARWLARDQQVGGWRSVTVGLFGALCVALLVLASYTFFTFDVT